MRLRRTEDTLKNIDWLTILLYFIMVIWGWLSIYSSIYQESVDQPLFGFSNNAGKQFLWICTSLIIIFAILLIEDRFFNSAAYIIYGFVILLLILVIFFGQEIAGSRSWFVIGGIKIQPTEFAKFATALGLAKYLSTNKNRFEDFKSYATAFSIFLIPFILIAQQGDMGSALVFASFIIVCYREGLHPLFIVIPMSIAALFILTLVLSQTILIISLIVLAILSVFFLEKTIKKIALIILILAISVGEVISVDYVLNNVLEKHQSNRIEVLINPNVDPMGAGWNITQAKIAIASGDATGKGYLNGIRTRYDFVPEQSTDFIFCTIGEELGWMGSLGFVGLYLLFLIRLTQLAERQKTDFTRIYGYGVVSIFFFHFIINIGMVIGLFPVIGIPLPFFSYGGSSLWAFTILLFVFLNLDARRKNILLRY